MKDKLSQPTPRKNTTVWKIGSFVYGFIVLLNQYVDMASDFGISEKAESYIRVAGIFIYFLFTYFNFNQSTFDEPKTL